MQTAPQALEPEAEGPGLLATAFTAKGRADRLRYASYLMSYGPLIMILGLFGHWYVIGVLAVVANYIFATIRRCHDLGLNGWWALVLGLPGPNLALLVIPGRGTNRYGDPTTSARSERLLALVLLVLSMASCGAYYLYVFRPAFQAYETRIATGGPPWEKRSGESPIIRFRFSSPTAGTISLETGQHTPMNYRARYRTLYVSFTLDGVLYMEQLRHDVRLNRLEMLDGDAIIGTYER